MSEDFTLTTINTQGLDTDLNNNFSELKTALEAETTRATTAEDTLTLNLSTFENTIQSALSAETARAMAAENTLTLDLSAFETATQSALSMKADLGGSATQRFKVADGVEATDAVNKEQLDTVSGATSHTLAAGTVLNVPSQYADIPAALAYLNGKTLLGVVTIQIANGTYSYTSPISINHPQSDMITIQGNPSNRSSVILNFTNCNGFSCSYAKTIRLSCLTLNGNDISSTNGIYSVGSVYCYNVVISNFGNGITKRSGCLDLDTCLITSNAFGIYLFGSATANIANSYITYNVTGAYISGGSSMSLSSVTATNNTTGYTVDNCAFFHILAGNTVSANTNCAIFANNNSFVFAVGASILGRLSPDANTYGNLNSYIQTV